MYRLDLSRSDATWIDKIRGVERVELESSQDTTSTRVTLIVGEGEVEEIRRLITSERYYDGDHSTQLRDRFDDAVHAARATTKRPRALLLHLPAQHAARLDELRGLEGEGLARAQRERYDSVQDYVSYPLPEAEIAGIRSGLRADDADFLKAFDESLSSEFSFDPDDAWSEDQVGFRNELVARLPLDSWIYTYTGVDPRVDPRVRDIADVALRFLCDDISEVEEPRYLKLGDPYGFPTRVLTAATRVYFDEPETSAEEALRRVGFLRA